MLKTDIEFRKGVLFIRLTGELNQNVYSIGKNNLRQFLEENGFRYVVFNLDKLTSIELSCIKDILNYDRKLKKVQGEVFLCEQNKYLCKRLFKNQIKTIQKENEVFNIERVY